MGVITLAALVLAAPSPCLNYDLTLLVMWRRRKMLLMIQDEIDAKTMQNLKMIKDNYH